MARLSSLNADVPDPAAINFTRLLARLQQNLITPDAETESRLRASQFEREKVGTNIDYAKELLTKLEQDAQLIKIQTKKQETQADLSDKRDLLTRLRERLDELNELGEYEDEKADDSEGEDLLGEDTPSEDTQSQASHAEPNFTTSSPIETIPPPLPIPSYPATIPDPPQTGAQPATQPDHASALRARHKGERAELFTPAATSTGISTSTPATEALLTHHRTEQEDLTNSLLSMAKALKESSHAFGSSLESEKDVIDNAAKSLDKSEFGMEAAQKRMGYLRTMTEGRGWWGRMLMYAWIAGLMVVAILIVFVLPKLRF